MPPALLHGYDLRLARALAVCALVWFIPDVSLAVHGHFHKPAVELQPELHRFTLDNGLKVIVAPQRAAAVVAVQAWVGVGSADERATEAGLAHVFEHMLFKGTPSRAVGAIAAEIEAAGGDINAWTSFDQTVYHVVLASRYFDVAIDVLGDAIQNSKLAEDDLEREREVILEEIRQGNDDPMRVAAQALFATAFDSHPYGLPVIGQAETVGKFRRRDLLTFFKRWYRAANTTLVIAGDVDVAEVKRRVARRFGKMPSGASRRLQPAPRPLTAARSKVVAKDVNEGFLLFGFHGPVLTDKASPVLDVAAIILGQGESSRLARTVRREEELVTSVYAYPHSLRLGSLFIVSSTSRPENLERAATSLGRELARLGREEVDPDELEKARRAVEADIVYQLETAQGMARKLGYYEALGGRAEFELEYLDRIRRVTASDIREAAQKYLQVNHAAVSAVVPELSGRRTSQLPRQRGLIRSAREGAKLGAKVAAKRKSTPPTVVREQLSSGATIVIKRDPAVPVVAIRAVWQGGVRHETEDNNGISNLIATLITRGCGDRDAEDIASLVDHMAGGLAGVAGRNSFGLRSEWLASTWEEGFELTAECILHPKFDAEEFARERRLLLDELEAREDSPSHVAFRNFSEALFTTHPYRLDPAGAIDAVAGLTRETLVAHYHRAYPLSGMTLAVVGDVDPQKVLARARKLFGGPMVVGGGVPALRPEVFSGRSEAERQRFETLEREQAHLIVGFPGLTVKDEDRHALEVLLTILGGQGGRLFVELRDRKSLAYRISAFSVDGIDPGFFAVYLSCAPDKVSEALSGIHHELDRVVAEPVGRDELERARQYLIGAHEISLQRRSAQASALAFHEAYGLGADAIERYPSAIAAVTVADVQRVAGRIVDWKLAVTSTVAPAALTPEAERRAKGVRKKAPRKKSKSTTGVNPRSKGGRN